MKKIFTLLIAIAFTVEAFSQVPEKMSYQAVIRDVSNALVTSHAIGMRISILQGSANGTAVYNEIQTPATNANGLVSVEIGGGAGFDNINWANDTYFIKTETDPTGGTNYTIIGVSQILSVPYAFYAKTSKTADYNDLTNKPVLFDGLWASLAGKPSLATVATSGSYNDLLDKPIFFDGTWVSLTGKPATLLGYGITDGMNTSHAANEITSINITDWNDAFSWGNHATAGYQLIIREVSDEFTATASQTSFTLTQTPSGNSKVKMFINGVRISNTAYSNTGNTLIYNPLTNGSYPLKAGDRVQFDYFY